MDNLQYPTDLPFPFRKVLGNSGLRTGSITLKIHTELTWAVNILYHTATMVDTKPLWCSACALLLVALTGCDRDSSKLLSLTDVPVGSDAMIHWLPRGTDELQHLHKPVCLLWFPGSEGKFYTICASSLAISWDRKAEGWTHGLESS